MRITVSRMIKRETQVFICLLVVQRRDFITNNRESKIVATSYIVIVMKPKGNIKVFMAVNQKLNKLKIKG